MKKLILLILLMINGIIYAQNNDTTIVYQMNNNTITVKISKNNSNDKLNYLSNNQIYSTTKNYKIPKEKINNYKTINKQSNNIEETPLLNKILLYIVLTIFYGFIIFWAIHPIFMLDGDDFDLSMIDYMQQNMK